MAERETTAMRESRSIRTWLFDPFRYVAGGSALALGLAAIVAAGTVALMYRSFTVSCNLSGGKALGVFVPAIIVGEVVSKLLIYGLLPDFLAAAGT